MLCVGIGSCKRGFHIHYPRVCPVTRHVDVHFLAILAFHFPVFPSWSFSILLCFYLLHSRYCFLSLLSLHTEKGGRENRLSLPTSHSLPPLLSVPLALVPHPSQFIILTWCYLTPLSLSPSLLLDVVFSLLYHPSFWPVCTVVPRCVWVKLCICTAEVMQVSVRQVIITSTGSVCSIVCVCVCDWEHLKTC